MNFGLNNGHGLLPQWSMIHKVIITIDLKVLVTVNIYGMLILYESLSQELGMCQLIHLFNDPVIHCFSLI